MSIDDVDRLEYLGNCPRSDNPILSLIVISIIVNIIFYCILPSKLSPLIKSNIISTIHAFISVIGVFNYFLRSKINFKQINRIMGGGLFGTGDEIMVYNVCYSTGYLIYDLIIMCKHKSTRTKSALIHHIIISITFSSGLFTGVSHPCHFFLLAEELSTIPLNLKTIYHENIRLHNRFSFLFVICFFLSRLFYGTIICIYAFRAAPQFLVLAWNNKDLISFSFGILQALLCVSTRILNFYWAFLISRKLFGLKKKTKKNL